LILKRLYGEREQSLQLIEDLEQLILRKAAFEADFAKLMSLYDQDEGFQEFKNKKELY